MKISLDRRSAIVTGGSKGIGFAIATCFVQSGADVVIIARGQEALNRAVKRLAGEGAGKAAGIAADVARAGDIERAYAEAGRSSARWTSSSTMRGRHGPGRSKS